MSGGINLGGMVEAWKMIKSLGIETMDLIEKGIVSEFLRGEGVLVIHRKQNAKPDIGLFSPNYSIHECFKDMKIIDK